MDAIDRAATRFGMPMGPLALTDLVGLETACLRRQGDGRTPIPTGRSTSPILEEMLKAGGPATKSAVAKFWITRRQGGKPAAEPGRRWRSSPSTRPAERTMSEEEITDRLFLPMLLEATRVLEEGIVREPADVDMGLILGIGFPPFRGGILRWCDSQGAGAVVERLARYAPLGKRYRADRDARSRWRRRARRSIPGPKLAAGSTDIRIRTFTAGERLR